MLDFFLSVPTNVVIPQLLSTCINLNSVAALAPSYVKLVGAPNEPKRLDGAEQGPKFKKSFKCLAGT